MILWNDNGAIIFSAYRALFSCGEALEAELSTCMEGLLFSIQRSELPGARMILRNDNGAIIFSTCRALFHVEKHWKQNLRVYGRTLIFNPKR